MAADNEKVQTNNERQISGTEILITVITIDGSVSFALSFPVCKKYTAHMRKCKLGGREENGDRLWHNTYTREVVMYQGEGESHHEEGITNPTLCL